MDTRPSICFYSWFILVSDINYVIPQIKGVKERSLSIRKFKIKSTWLYWEIVVIMEERMKEES